MGRAETYVDVSAELLADLLHLNEHEIRISGARGLERGVIRLYLAADHLPPGQVKALYQQYDGGKVVLKTVEPA